MVLINQFQTKGVVLKYTDYELTFPESDLLVNRKDLDFFCGHVLINRSATAD